MLAQQRASADVNLAAVELASAQQAFERARFFRPSDETIYQRLATVALQSGRSAEAVQLLTAAQQIAPDNMRVVRDLALAYEANADWPQALAVWGQLGLSADSFIALAAGDRQAGSFDSAITWYIRADAAGRDTASAISYTHYEAALKRQDTPAAIVQLEETVTLDRGWVDAAQRTTARFQLASHYVEARRYDEALPLLETLLRQETLEPPVTRSEVLRHLALSHWGRNDMEPALNAAREAVTLAPDSVWAHIHYGKILYVAQPNAVAEVRQEFMRALELGEQNPGLWANLIGFWQWQSQTDEAEAMCQQAYSLGIHHELESFCDTYQ